MTTKTMTVETSSATPSMCMPMDSRALDVDVTVTLPDGHEIEGEVTLLPAEDGMSGYGSWGEPANWVSGRLLVDLHLAYPAHDDFRRALAEIEAAASAECGLPE